MIIRPSNIEELRQLYIQIINGNHAIRLSPRNQSVLKSMLDAPSATATKSISELAQENNINISSITRLAQKLGFIGFPDLKNLFRQHLNQKKNFYSGQVEKHLLKGHSGSTEATQALQHVIQDEWSNVMVMADEFDDKMFTSVIALLANAQRIRVIGLRGSYPLAYYLNFYLNMIRDDVSLLGQAGHSWAEELAALKEGDLLVAIGFSPYTRDTVSACKIAKNKNIDLVVITDSNSSPLAIEADNFLLTSIQGDYFFSPIAAAMIIIEALLSALVKKLGPNSIQQLDHAETILNALNIEI
ncbi:MAG: MurR/RpiR family transcriptional regulator [Desulfotalea sp.]